MTKLFIWGTLTTMANGGGRGYFDNPKKKPIERRVIQGIDGEIYELNDKELKRIDKFERHWGYIRVEIEPQLYMYVLSPVMDHNYWKNLVGHRPKILTWDYWSQRI